MIHLEITMDSFWQLMIFSLLKGIGNALVRVQDVELLLSSLMKRRRQYYFEMDKSFQRLSEYEVDILCLLLEVIEGLGIFLVFDFS